MAISESELEALYETELGRITLDPGGKEYWMNSGLTPEQIKSQLSGISQQAGFKEAAREADITQLYQEELGRTQVDDPGLAYWMAESEWDTRKIQKHFDQLEEGQLHNEGLIVWDYTGDVSTDPDGELLRLKRDPVTGAVTTGEGGVGATWYRTDQDISYSEGIKEWTEADKLLEIKQTLGMGNVYGKAGQVGGEIPNEYTPSWDFSTGDFNMGDFDFNEMFGEGYKIGDPIPGMAGFTAEDFGPRVYGEVQRPDTLKFVNDPLEEDAKRWRIDTQTNVGDVVADYLDTGSGFTEFREELPGGAYFGSTTPSPRREQWLQTARGRGETPSTTRGQTGVIEPEQFQGRDRSGARQRKSGFRRPTTGAQI